MLQETRFLSKKTIEEINELREAIRNFNVKVVCMGLYNAGKSTLLNTLIGDFEHKTFKTADHRETTENKEFYLENKGIIFIDTPGLNAEENDDRRVMDAVKTSDINLFVHNIAIGEFQKKEVEFFNLIKKHWKNPEEFVKSTIFVLSRVDEKTPQEIEDIKNKMEKQIKDYFGVEAIFVLVSAKRYTEGMLKNKKLLIKKGNIDNLKKLIVDLKELKRENIVKNRKERLINKYEYLIKSLSSKEERNKLEITKLKRKLLERKRELKEDIEKIRNTLVNYYQRLENV